LPLGQQNYLNSEAIVAKMIKKCEDEDCRAGKRTNVGTISRQYADLRAGLFAMF